MKTLRDRLMVSTDGNGTALERRFRLMGRPFAPNESDVLALEQDPSHPFAHIGLRVDFIGLAQDKVHVLIEAHDFALDSHRWVICQPHLNASFVLQITEDQVNGLYHHLLDLLGLVRHLC